MGIFSETVPREQYEDLKAQLRAGEERYRDLMEKYHALRPTHAPVKPITATLPKPDSGEQALHAVELAVRDPNVARVAQKFVEEQGMNDADAFREAKRLADIARGRLLPPNLATPPEPPSR